MQLYAKIMTSLPARQWLILIAFCSLIALTLGFERYNSYNRIDTDERQKLSSAARIIDENLQAQLFVIDRSLSSLRKDFTLISQRPDSKLRLQRRLSTLSESMIGVRTLLIINADGIAIASNREELVGRNFSEREYFNTTRQSNNPDILHISRPFKTVLGVFAINLSKSLHDAGGKFTGIITATLDSEYFSTLLDSVRYAPDMWTGLNHVDGQLFLMMPPRPDIEGMNLAKPGTFYSRFHESGMPSTVMTGVVYATGEERMVAQRSMNPVKTTVDKSLDVTAARDLSAIFAGWRKDTLASSALFFILLLISSLGLFFHQRRQQADLLILNENIAKTRQAEYAKNQAEQLQADTLNSILSQIAVLDQNGIILTVNEAWLRFSLENSNVPGQQASNTQIGVNYLEICRNSFDDSADSLLAYEGLRSVIAGRLPVFKLEYPCDSPMNKRWFLMLVTPLSENHGVVVTHIDITQIKLREQEALELREQLAQAYKMESIGHLTSGIAHDFNNMLGAMMGYTELALLKLKTGKPDGVQNHLEEILKISNRAKELILQMLTFSRVSSGVTNTEAPITNLSTIVKEVAALLHTSIPSTIETNYLIESEALRARIQPVNLHQIILNLGVNARDAVGKYGKIDISLSERHIDHTLCSSCRTAFAGIYAQISVKDSGSGIPGDILLKIFDPFYTTKDVGKGTGMGLSVVHGLVHAQGGHILVETSEKTGTKFNILLPIALSEPSTQVVTNSAPAGSIKGIKIMLVDDEPMITDMLHEFLTNYGAQVEAFNNPVTALEIFTRNINNFDLVITDETMPGKSGMHFAEELLKIKPGLPIILCTGYSELANMDSATEIGVAGFFQKPLNLNDLLQKIVQLCKA